MGYTYNPKRSAELDVMRAETDRIRQALATQYGLMNARRELAALEKSERDNMDEDERYEAAEKVRRNATARYGDTPAEGERRMAAIIADATGYSLRRRTKENAA